MLSNLRGCIRLYGLITVNTVISFPCCQDQLISSLHIPMQLFPQCRIIGSFPCYLEGSALLNINSSYQSIKTKEIDLLDYFLLLIIFAFIACVTFGRHFSTSSPLVFFSNSKRREQIFGQICICIACVTFGRYFFTSSHQYFSAILKKREHIFGPLLNVCLSFSHNSFLRQITNY